MHTGLQTRLYPKKKKKKKKDDLYCSTRHDSVDTSQIFNTCRSNIQKIQLFLVLDKEFLNLLVLANGRWRLGSTRIMCWKRSYKKQFAQRMGGGVGYIHVVEKYFTRNISSMKKGWDTNR